MSEWWPRSPRPHAIPAPGFCQLTPCQLSSGLKVGHLLGEASPIRWSKATLFSFPGRSVVTPSPHHSCHVWNSSRCLKSPSPDRDQQQSPKKYTPNGPRPRHPLPSTLLPTGPPSKSPMLGFCEGHIWSGGLAAPKPGNGQALCPWVLPGWLPSRGPGEPAKEAGDETRLSRPCPGSRRNHSMRDNDKAVTAVTMAYLAGTVHVNSAFHLYDPRRVQY